GPAPCGRASQLGRVAEGCRRPTGGAESARPIPGARPASSGGRSGAGPGAAIQVMSVIALSQTAQASQRAWLRHGAALAVLLLLMLAAFRHSIAAAVTVWWVSPTYSHCFLILPIVLWLVWEKRGP